MTFKDLGIWQKGINLVTEVYVVTRQFPREELYGITNQIRRAAISIPSNIAEGFGRNSRPEMNRYTQIALGSLCELETQLLISKNLSFAPQMDLERLLEMCSELNSMLRSFSHSIRHPKTQPNLKI